MDSYGNLYILFKQHLFQMLHQTGFNRRDFHIGTAVVGLAIGRVDQIRQGPQGRGDPLEGRGRLPPAEVRQGPGGVPQHGGLFRTERLGRPRPNEELQAVCKVGKSRGFGEVTRGI